MCAHHHHKRPINELRHRIGVNGATTADLLIDTTVLLPSSKHTCVVLMIWLHPQYNASSLLLPEVYILVLISASSPAVMCCVIYKLSLLQYIIAYPAVYLMLMTLQVSIRRTDTHRQHAQTHTHIHTEKTSRNQADVQNTQHTIRRS